MNSCIIARMEIGYTVRCLWLCWDLNVRNLGNRTSCCMCRVSQFTKMRKGMTACPMKSHFNGLKACCLIDDTS